MRLYYEVYVIFRPGKENYILNFAGVILSQLFSIMEVQSRIVCFDFTSFNIMINV